MGKIIKNEIEYSSKIRLSSNIEDSSATKAASSYVVNQVNKKADENASAIADLDSKVTENYTTKTEVSEGYVAKEEGKGLSTKDFTENYANIVDKLSESEDGNLLYDGKEIKGEDQDLSPYETKEELATTLEDYAQKSELHNHENKEILDKINTSENGDLLFDGKSVSSITKEEADELKQLKNDMSSSLDNSQTAYEHSQTTGNPHGTTLTDLGIENVENKSSEEIRGELTFENVTDALGYTPEELVELTKDEYNALIEANEDKKDVNYYITDDNDKTFIPTIEVDDALSDVSANPVQNQVITAELNKKVNKDEIENKLIKKIDIGKIVDNLTSNDNSSVLSAKQGKILDDKITNLNNLKIQYSTTDLTAGVSTLQTGVLYVVYE